MLEVIFVEGVFVRGALDDVETDYSDEHTGDSDDFASSSEDHADDQTLKENLG